MNPKKGKEYASHPLNGFFVHGVRRTDVIQGDQYLSDCPFPDCTREDKFYINTKTKLWDCKVCSRKGNYLQFLEAISKENQKFLKKEQLAALAEDRNLPPKAFNGYGIGWDEEKFTFPIYNAYKKFVGLKCYKSGYSMFSTKDTKVELYCSDRLIDNRKDPVYLCEGEWDLIAMTWLLNKLKKKGVVVAVPGSGTFKDEWVEFFYGRDVIALYDNDEAGQKGEMKCFSMLQEVAKSIRFIHWPDSKKDGYDIRDLVGIVGYRKNRPKKAYKLIRKWLQEVPRGLLNEAYRGEDGKYRLEEQRKENVAPITFQELIAEFKAFLYMPDITPIKIILATLLANRVPGDMVWMFLVAPPSSAKTELLTSLFMCPEVVSVTSLSQNTLISGFMGPGKNDYSLLPKLKNKVLVIKDFTGILTMQQAQRDAIFGQLRDAYDRRSEKMFGHGLNRIYKDIHFGILAGVTNTIENINVMQQTLGERFIRYYLPADNTEDAIMSKMKKALSNVSFEPEKQKLLQDAVKRFMLTFEGTNPEIGAAIEEKIIYLARLTAKMRGIVPRDFRGDTILYKPQSEGPMRVGKQLYKMAVALANLEGKKEVGQEEYDIVKKLALGSCPSRVEAVVHFLYNQQGKPITHKETVDKIGFNHATIKSVVEDLVMLGIVTEEGVLRRRYYRLSDDATFLIEKGDVYSQPRSTKKIVFKVSA